MPTAATRPTKKAAATPLPNAAADPRPDVGLPPADRDALMAALAAPIDPVRVRPLYSAGLVLVAAAMLLLPLVYVGLIAGVGYAVYYHAVHDATILGGRGNAKGRFLVYVAPLVVGGVLVVFMVKPLFARRPKAAKPVSLDRDAEPLLFEFVARLCRAVGAPAPVRIDVDCQVNASAGFRSQGPFGWLGRRLVLTIGLPLAAGLDVRQFAGVLAHEFGHFAQGTGMRVTYVIRSVNRWFARVVYERDSWDDKLRDAAGAIGGGGAIIVLTARAMVWLTRRVLWCLMMVGHGISSFMLRQMEFDADQYEARVAGAAAFEQTTRRLRALNLGQDVALNEVQAAWRERRLADDLPALVRRREHEMPGEVRAKLHAMATAQKTGWFDSHPCDADRVAAARRGSPPGVIPLDAPAAALFADFPAACRRVTAAFYKGVLGHVPADAIVPTDALAEKRETQRQRYDALERYFQGLVHAVRPVYFDDARPLPASADEAAAVILVARSDLEASAAEARAAAAAWAKCMGTLVGVARGQARSDAGLRRWKPQDLGLAAGDEARLNALRAEQSTAAGMARKAVDAVLADQMHRLRSALHLAELEKPVPVAAEPPAPTDDTYGLAGEPAGGYGPADAYGVVEPSDAAPGSTDRLLRALAALRRHADTTEALRVAELRLGELLGQLKPENNGQPLIEATLAAAREVARLLQALRDGLSVVPYPYDHGEQGMTLGRHAVPAVPNAEAVGDVYQAADAATDAVYGLYGRMLSDLAEQAERAEQGLGLVPLPPPPEAGGPVKPADPA